jgi:serine/threonine-protein kinase
MGLSAGTRLGPYEIAAPLGAGGMGEVYRAHDSRLSREVAIKVLPPSFLNDPEHLARLDREARLLAALNHPHIAAIYGVEDAHGIRALVLELVSGPTLAERISHGPLAMNEALVVARQIAEALEAAHERGIMHRDLKPANIKLTDNGKVKVLDFGLAKAQAATTVDSSLTASLEVTRAGSFVGTAAYMSPEQARGKPVDKRTDIWAFGCVLYEMLTGRLAFQAETLSDTIAAVLDREPDWERLPNLLPAAVRRLLRRCLEKDPDRRLRDIGDGRLELEDALAGEASAESAGAPSSKITRRTALGALAGAALGAGAGVGILEILRPYAPVRAAARFAIAMPEGELHQSSFNDRIAIAPDGTRVAFNTVGSGGIKLYTRSLSELETKLLQDVTSGASAFFSADARWMGFFQIQTGGNLIRKVRLSGGAPVTMCSAGAWSGATWAQDDVIYFVSETPGGVFGIPAAGGQPREVVAIDGGRGERVLKFPHALPGGKVLLLTAATADSESFDDAQIVAVSLRNGERKVLVERGTHARYSRSGHVLYARDGKLLAVRFNPDRLEVTGQPATVLEGVLMSRNSGMAGFDISASGDLVYLPGKAEGGARRLVWVDRSGKAEPLPLPPRSYLHPRISPDARRLAIEIEGASHDCYVYDFASGVLSNITTDGLSHWPIWSPDGKTIGYRSGPMGRFRLWEVPADRSAPARQVSATGVSQSAESYSPDGRTIAYTLTAGPGSSPPKIAVASLQGSADPKPLEDTKYAQGSPKFSPDGRWLAYCSNESGKPQVYVQAFPGPGARIQVSSDGGTDPVWRRTGSELFYRNGDSMMVVPVTTAPSFSAARPQELWKGHYSHGMSSSCGPPGPTSSNYDVTADGQRFLMVKDEDQDAATSKQMIVALGWADELARRA